MNFAVEASRASVHAVAWAIWVASFAAWESVFAAMLGGFAGCIVGRALASTRVRSLVGVGACVLLLALGWLAGLAIVGSMGDWLALGPSLALRLGDLVSWCLIALCVSALFRFTSSRYPAMAVSELLLVGTAFAQALMAHRHGLINRPFELADLWIASNWDPRWIFIGLGAAAAAAGLVLFMRENRYWRVLLHLGVVAALLFVVAGTARTPGLTAADDPLGMRGKKGEDGDNGGKPKPGQGGQGDSQKQEQQSGPSNEDLEFRDQYNPSGNQAPMAVVLFHDDYSPSGGVYYFRQGAFSQYNGRKLVSASRADVDRDLIPAFPSGVLKVPDAPPPSPHRTTLDTTVALMADHNRPFAIEAPVQVQPTNNPDPNRFKRIYRATSSVLSADDATLLDYDVGSDAWSEDQWAHYTQTPDDQRYADLSAEIVQVLPDAYKDEAIAKAFAITDWLSRKGIYSLTNTHAGSDDPVGSFLFGDRTGYCVHFAHAATYLMRAQGIPSRIGTGYAVDEANRQGGSALLLGGNTSHAWPEVFVDQFGWVVLDVYPQQSNDPPPQPMDSDLQTLLGELARGATPLPPSSTDLPKLKRLVGDWAARFGIWLMLFAVGLLVWMFGVKFWRALVPRFSGPSTLPRVLYRAQLDRLSDVRVRRDRGESREAFARRVGPLVPSLERITNAHLQSRFGKTPPDPGAMRQDAENMREQLRAGTARWRRALGWITPWTWLRTK